MVATALGSVSLLSLGGRGPRCFEPPQHRALDFLYSCKELSAFWHNVANIIYCPIYIVYIYTIFRGALRGYTTWLLSFEERGLC